MYSTDHSETLVMVCTHCREHAVTFIHHLQPCDHFERTKAFNVVTGLLLEVATQLVMVAISPVHSPVHGPVQSPESRFCSIPSFSELANSVHSACAACKHMAFWLWMFAFDEVCNLGYDVQTHGLIRCG